MRVSPQAFGRRGEQREGAGEPASEQEADRRHQKGAQAEPGQNALLPGFQKARTRRRHLDPQTIGPLHRQLKRRDQIVFVWGLALGDAARVNHLEGAAHRTDNIAVGGQDRHEDRQPGGVYAQVVGDDPPDPFIARPLAGQALRLGHDLDRQGIAPHPLSVNGLGQLGL